MRTALQIKNAGEVYKEYINKILVDNLRIVDEGTINIPFSLVFTMNRETLLYLIQNLVNSISGNFYKSKFTKQEIFYGKLVRLKPGKLLQFAGCNFKLKNKGQWISINRKID